MGDADLIYMNLLTAEKNRITAFRYMWITSEVELEEESKLDITPLSFAFHCIPIHLWWIFSPINEV